MAMAKSQMKAVKTEQDLRSAPASTAEQQQPPSRLAGRLSQLRGKASQVAADSKDKAAQISKWVSARAQAAKVQVVDSATLAKDKTFAGLSAIRQGGVEKTEAAKAAARQVQAAAGASYERLRANGLQALVADNAKAAQGLVTSAALSVRSAVSIQYKRASAGASSSLKSVSDALHSRATALVTAARGAFSNTVKTSVKAVETVKVKASELTSNAKAATQNKHVRATAAGVAGGAATLGATGAATGLATGTVLGAAVGVVPAFFTFGLSIPIAAAIGGGAGMAVGTTVGATAGAVGGGAAGYGVYAKKDQIKELKNGVVTKVASGMDVVKMKASSSASFLTGQASAVRTRLTGKKE